MIHDLDYSRTKSTHAERVKRVAERQRNLTVLLLVLLAISVISCGFRPLALLLVAGTIYLWVVFYRLMVAMGTKPAWIVAAMVGLFIPLVQLMVIIIVDYQAREILRAAGLKVGFTGVREEDLARFEQEEM